MAHSPSLGVSFSAPRVFAAEMISPVTAQLHRAKGRGSKAGAGAGAGAGVGIGVGIREGVGASLASWVSEVVDSSNQAVLRPLWLSDLKMKDVWGSVSTESWGCHQAAQTFPLEDTGRGPRSPRGPRTRHPPQTWLLAPQPAAAVPVL